MKVYVSKLPKDCIECPFCQDIKVNAGMDRLLFCKANKGKAIKNIEKSFDKCIVKNEFQSLADYTKQVRKEVLSELRNMLGDRAELIDFGNGCAEFMFTTYDLQECSKEILDQIEQGKQND